MIPLTPNNPDIWFYHFAVNFPFAWLPETTDDEGNMLGEFLETRYKLPKEEWCNELTGGLDKNDREPDSWQGCSINIGINDKVSLGVEFHPFETLFFLNDTYAGETGGHARLSLISWQELLEIACDNDPLFMMLLPLTTGNKKDKEEIIVECIQRLSGDKFPFNAEDLKTISEYLASHLIHEEDVQYTTNPELGIISDRRHSGRNPKENSPEEIIELNHIIEMAKRTSKN